MLVACKCDLEVRREVSEERGRELAASKDLRYFETSAVSENLNSFIVFFYPLFSQRDHRCVNEPFLHLASKYRQLYQQNELVLQEITSH